MKRVLSVSIFLALLVFACVVPAFSQTKTIWEIGKNDQSAAEFKASQRDHLVYQVGRSDWTQVWPAEQRTGSAYEIRFNLDAAPRGTYLLEISLLTGYLRTPDIQVEINGHKGVYYVRPKPLYTTNNALLTIELPTRYMAKGDNSLILSPVNRDTASAGSVAPFESFRYDYIGITNKIQHKTDDVRADVAPTVFYHQQKEGQLVELVDAYLRFGQSNPTGHAVLTLNGKSYSAEVVARDDLGEERVEFQVPEWRGTSPAKLEVAAGIHRSFNLPLTAERKWTVFVVPHTHVDIGYTDYQGKVAENQAESLVEAADLIKKYPDFRFATDGSRN